MTDPLNKGDELCVYALCDMLKQHAFIYTKTKPWTTVDGSIADLTVAELYMICDVCLIFVNRRTSARYCSRCSKQRSKHGNGVNLAPITGVN